MPLYAYHCHICGRVEIRHGEHDGVWDRCPTCGSQDLEREDG